MLLCMYIHITFQKACRAARSPRARLRVVPPTPAPNRASQQCQRPSSQTQDFRSPFAASSPLPSSQLLSSLAASMVAPHFRLVHVAWTLQRSYHELSWYSLSSLSSSSCSFSSSLSVSVMSRIQRSSTAPLCSHAPGSLAKPEDLDCPFRLVAGLSQRCPQCT